MRRIITAHFLPGDGGGVFSELRILPFLPLSYQNNLQREQRAKALEMAQSNLWQRILRENAARINGHALMGFWSEFCSVAHQRIAIFRGGPLHQRSLLLGAECSRAGPALA